MNIALRHLLPLLTISLNEGGTEGGGGGGGGEGEGGGEGAAGEGSSGDGKGAGSNAPPPPTDDDKAFTTKLEAKLKGERETNAKAFEAWKPKLPENMPFDEKGFGDYRKLFIEAGLKPEQAQKFVDAFAGAELGRLKTVAEGLKAEEATWSKTLLSDKELAGEGSDAERKAHLEGKTMPAAARAMNKLATKEFREVLRKSGLERHPEMIRLMARAGAGITEDTTSGSRSSGKGPEPTAKQKLQARYPNSKEMFKDS